MKKICIINTGGTFNKVYHPITGTLDINKEALNALTSKWLCHIETLDIIQKDSLAFEDKDRETLLQKVLEIDAQAIIIVHGTDTMELSAQYLATHQSDKVIVLTGAMVPYSIDPVEATANLASAYGFLQAEETPGVYIAMHAIIAPYHKVTKERKEGRFIALP